MPGTILLIIDPQNDFHEGGSLAVAGATDDSTRIANLIKVCGSEIDEIMVTLDSHHACHISHGVYWKNSAGEPAPDFTEITLQSVKDGTWSPARDEDKEHVEWYLEQLEGTGRFKHIIWPQHCLIGTPGHAVVPVLNEALQEWSVAKHKTIKFLAKGMNVKTEMYSPFKAEVQIPDDPSTGLNTAVLEELAAADRVLVCGESFSHCVNHGLRDLAAALSAAGGAEACARAVLLTDGTSCVAGFESAGAQLVEDMRALGVQTATCEEAAKLAKEGSTSCIVS